MKLIDFDIIKKQFKENGLLLKSKSTYSGVDNKTLHYICSEGHEITTSFRLWRKNKGCKICNIKKRGISSRLSIEFVRGEFKKKEYTLITKDYENSQQKLEYVCSRGHNHKLSYANFKMGKRCLYCVKEDMKKNLSLPYDFVKEQFESKGYKLLSKTYKNAKQKLEYICPNNHKWRIDWNKFQQGRGCPKCYGSISKAETDIFNIIKSKFKDAKQSNRQLIKPLELDIVIPSKKIAIEYCGLYWHSQLNGGKDRNYHLNKLIMCNKKGYNLITIFEDEWLNKKDILLGRLKNILGVSDSKRVYARKCIIKVINGTKGNLFLNKFHIQGKYNSSINLGLYFEDELVAVMGFSKPSIAKGKSNYEYELTRFCSNYNYSVIGGASKLFSYFVRNYAPKSVISFADKRWSSGGMYGKLGFKKIEHSTPNYWYIVKDTDYFKRMHRFNFRKSELSKKLDNFNPNLSEWKNMTNNGFDRIWDCGNLKYVYEGQ